MYMSVYIDIYMNKWAYIYRYLYTYKVVEFANFSGFSSSIQTDNSLNEFFKSYLLLRMKRKSKKEQENGRDDKERI